MSQIRPLRNLIVVQPDPAPHVTDGGVMLPENVDIPPMSGRVVALGDGPARDRRVRLATIARCLAILDEAAIDGVTKDDAIGLARDEMLCYSRQTGDAGHTVQVGDRVIFPQEAGYEIVVGERTDALQLFLSEDAILAVCADDVPLRAA